MGGASTNANRVDAVPVGRWYRRAMVHMSANKMYLSEQIEHLEYLSASRGFLESLVGALE
jgi:hypothetical protein